MGIKDIAGQRFGRLVALECVGSSKPQGIAMWLCQCDCGKQTTVRGPSLRGGITSSCGCISRDTRTKDLVGQRFGRLVVAEYIKNKKGRWRWRCLCDCGELSDVNGIDLRRGHISSCGCGQRDPRTDLKKEPSKVSFSKLLDCWVVELAQNGGVALVSHQDVELVRPYRWYNSRGYATSRPSKDTPYYGQTIQMHRLIFFGSVEAAKASPSLIDHGAGGTSDNRRENLRESSYTENSRHRVRLSSRNTSGVHGVSFSKQSGKWAAAIRVDGKSRHLGFFENIEDAAKARKQAARVLFGEFVAELDKEP